MWMIFLNDEERRATKQDLYLAQIAAEIRRANSKKNVSVKDLLLKFTKKKKLTKEQATAASKSRWFGFLGLDKDGNKS